ncbi:hypothetical protein [Pararhizobium antarcticum]|uniref:Uncharacterized protein n=1 Tax=Pararhizobium antarcticum TaxID=1798805 RepID=A0A657LX95_9HYPH|nr:hypothetical protein [Pararhizobium antarcticum]OJF95470.1 hypothetical protein AX761_17860 [Rhizobium sp. 58]OJF99936.1 hypothetical protein AX760_25645 [Pararhizobium antarcticum]
MDDDSQSPARQTFLNSRYLARVQPHLRNAATKAGLARACRLPKCRRAGRCSAMPAPAEASKAYFPGLPPCVRDAALYDAMMVASDALDARLRQEEIDTGLRIDHIERMEAALVKAVWEDGPWPADPLARAAWRNHPRR